MRTFSSTDWQRAQAAWADGAFSDEWAPFRAAAAQRGMIDPPAGSRFDSWDDEPPSQRAILIREIRDRPAHLLGVIRRSRSWTQVVRVCISHLDDIRAAVPPAARPDPIARAEARQRDAELLASILRRTTERTEVAS